MEKGLWACIGIMAVIIIALLVKIHTLRKAIKEIEAEFADKLATDTNGLITVSSRDKYLRSLASQMNVQLAQLREQRHRFQQGDTELKNAVTNISHDLRTPLTAICGYLDLLEQEEKSETVERYVQVIQNRTEMLIQLTDELFRYSVIMATEDKLERQPVVINSVLEESVAGFYATLTEQGITPTIEMPEEKIICNLDPSGLSRIFSNLLNNALKYSDGDLEITLSKAGEITFSNNAPTLDEVQVGKLFDRFYTVESARKSTGLGLSITRTLVEQMGGSVSAKYQKGRLYICIVFLES